MSFQVHPQLANDLVFLKEEENFIFYGHPNNTNPWIVMIPKQNDVKEIHELSPELFQLTWQRVSKISSELETKFNADKINIGALGNIVPQLHIHIISRFKDDIAWPGAIWGSNLEYDGDEIRLKKLYLECIE